MTRECKCCGRIKECRMEFCWDCVESESVIEEGLNMYDEKVPEYHGLSNSMNKVKYILNKYLYTKNHANGKTES
jgi:hypothetical protein